ncbi:MAG: neutral trehalase [Myxococcota bacterium]
MRSSAKSALAERARELLRLNDRGAHTVPSARLYPHMWAWDSAFAAIGWSTFDLERGVVELETLMGSAWSDGRVPHITFDPASLGDYFPGPDVWGHAKGSTITQPPAWALAAEVLLKRGADAERIAALLPAIERSHAFFREQRDPLELGLAAVVHPWESGMDNSPAWDKPLSDIDPNSAPAFKRIDVNRVDDPNERPTDDEYKRYIALVDAIREDGFGPGIFAVYDPMMSTMLGLADAALDRLATSLGVKSEAGARAKAVPRALEQHLWNPATSSFEYLDAGAQERYAVPTLGSLFPALLPDLDSAITEEVLGRLDSEWSSPFPFPTVPTDSPIFDARRYWRGPTWIVTNWLFGSVLGSDVREQSIALLEKSGFREYFDPLTGEGLGATEFTWSAALALDWIVDEEST